MNLPFLKSIQPQKKEKREYFFALLLKPFKIGAILFKEEDNGLHIITSSEKVLDAEVETLSTEELLASVDHVISTVETSLPEGVEVTKTIFSLPYNYIAEGKIKKDYLLKFKKLCENLGLTPMGFIVTVEAIVYFLQKKEGIPITSIFVEITKEIVYVYMVRAGNIIEVKFSDRSDNVAGTIEKILRHVESFEVLPTKIVLLAYEGIDEIQQELLSHAWGKNIAFLHDPQIITLEKGFEDEAIINGVASQMGFDISADEITHGEQISDEVVSRVDEEKTEIIEEDNENFGFLKENEVGASQKKETVANTPSMDEEYEEEPSAHPTRNNRKYGMSIPALPSMAFLGNVQNIISSLIDRLRVTGKPARGRKLLIMAIVIIILVGGFGWIVSYAYYGSFVKSEIILFASKKNFEKEIPITFSDDKQTSVEDEVIKISTVTYEVEGSASKDTTGKKETGEKAKGEVVIYNKTESKKTFEKGSVLVGSNNLEFELTGDVTIASTAAFSTNFSNAKAQVTAVKFGSEYNLPSNTNFSFKQFPTSSFFAKNESALTGGTKKNLDIVAKKDLDALATEVIDSVEAKALDEIQIKVGDGQVALPFIISSEFANRTYSKKEGDEAKTLTLDAKVRFIGGAYKRSDIEKFEEELIRKDIPDGYVRLLTESHNEVRDEKNNDGEITANLLLKSAYVPSIDETKVKESLRGKSQEEAEKLLKEIENSNGYKVLYSNNFSIFPQRLPTNEKNITLTIRFE